VIERRPAYGVGIAWRHCIHAEVMRCGALVDFVEIPGDDYVDPELRARFDPHERKLAEVAARHPAVGHGTGLSLGTAAAPDGAYLTRLADFVARHPIAEYSEHLAFIRGATREVDAFMALPFTDLGVAVAVENLKRTRAALGIPLLVENVAYYFALPGATMSEAEFLSRVATEADCGILLDVANLHVNAVNHRYDALEFLAALPAERVLHAHFCGASRGPDDFLYDTHFEPTWPPIWRLLEAALERTALRALILERDREFVPFRGPMDEIWFARERFAKHRGAKARPAAVKREPTVVPPSAVHSASLLALQDALCRMLLDAEFGAAVARSGSAALEGIGLDREAREQLAAIEPSRRERIGARLRESLVAQGAKS
jgi:uncharacterized protein (UPF0276 family)